MIFPRTSEKQDKVLSNPSVRGVIKCKLRTALIRKLQLTPNPTDAQMGAIIKCAIELGVTFEDLDKAGFYTMKS